MTIRLEWDAELVSRVRPYVTSDLPVAEVPAGAAQLVRPYVAPAVPGPPPAATPPVYTGTCRLLVIDEEQLPGDYLGDRCATSALRRRRPSGPRHAAPVAHQRPSRLRSCAAWLLGPLPVPPVRAR